MTEPKPLDLSGCEPILEGASEFLRMWNRPGGPVTCFIDPFPIGADPFGFGLALMDCVGHGANAYAQALGMRVKRIVAVSESAQYGPDAMSGVANFQASSASTTIDVGGRRLSATVNVTFELE